MHCSPVSHTRLWQFGYAIIILSLGIRVALLPLTIRLARRALRNQEIMRALQPEVEQLRKRFEKKPKRFFEEMRKLYRKHDCRPFDMPTLIGIFVQLPIFGMLYSSIRSSLSFKERISVDKESGFSRYLANLGRCFLGRHIRISDALKFRASKHVNRHPDDRHIFVRLETGGWIKSILGIIESCGSFPDLMAPPSLCLCFETRLSFATANAPVASRLQPAALGGASLSVFVRLNSARDARLELCQTDV